jgi:hypothetical protein
MGLSEVSRVFEAATRQFVAVLGAARKGTTGLYEFPLQGSSQAASILQILEDVSAAMQRVLEAKSRRRVQRSTSQPDPPARLLTQIYRPDVWMVAPPRCNVIFPEAYSQFSYGRNFQQEVTRMLLRTSSAFFGSDILFDGFYMAPSRLLGARTGKNIAKGRIGVEPADMADTPAWVVKDMMDHELFTGIIPSFERMTDLNLHAIRGGSIEINGAKVGYAQLACNHIFFQHRFKSRELMMSGRFNPYLTLGFPAVIVDKYLNDDQLRNGEYDTAVAVRLADQFKQANTPLPSQQRQEIVEANQAGVDEVLALTAPRGSNHYLGTSSLIVHSLTATGGGTTQVQMTYARSTDERTEFLGDNVGTSSKAKRIKNVKVPTVVAAFEPPTVGAKGYMGGQILEARDVTDQYQKKQTPKKGRTALGAERFASSTQLPLFVQGKAAGRVRRGTRVPVGVEMAASAYGPEVVALVGSGGGTAAGANEALVTFRAFRIVEEVGSYARTEVELPPEDLTFPPWYGESYRTNQIGGLYSYYFGVGAITDPTVILGTTSPKTFGDGDSARTLYLQFENSMARVTQNALQSVSQPGQRPTPGSTGAPGVAGGGDIGPAGTSNPETDSVLGQIGARSPIAVAIEELVKAYSATRSQQFDTPQFVQNYTWRPIASMVDIFGTSNLVIDDNGFVQSGREGFHSRAFGAYDDLRQLVNQTGGAGPQKILGLAAGTKELSTDEDDPEARVSARLDTRKEKQAAVMKYLYAIASARGVVLG